ncbi:MAG: hypothetical protein IKW14_00495 [Phascolarctobacterium sp.]|nr:hypothetical protein [Phascolarctobacterium sp.]
METIKNGRHEFEVVESVPKHYFIWNIGKNMVDGYLPLCEWLNPEDTENFSINVDTLKAVKLPEAQLVLEAVPAANTPWGMETYIKKYSEAAKGTWEYRMVERMKKALPILEKANIWRE